MLRGGLRPQNF